MSGDGTHENGRAHIDFRVADAEEVRRMMDRGIADALDQHKRAGRPIAVWDYRSGAVRMVPPDRIASPPVEEGGADDLGGMAAGPGPRGGSAEMPAAEE